MERTCLMRDEGLQSLRYPRFALFAESPSSGARILRKTCVVSLRSQHASQSGQ
jgi:hypothetical protein